MPFEIILADTIRGVSENPILSGLTILVLFTLIQEFFLFKRLRKLVRGGDGKSLEGTIRKLLDRVTALETEALKNTRALRNAEERIKRSIQSVSVTHFDPFQNAGGLQSFSSALLSEKGDGVIVSGIHSRDGVRVYAKPVTNFSSERELSADEQGTITDARKKLELGK